MKKLLYILPLFLSAPLHAALFAGDIAIIGFQDNGAPDSFTIVALAAMPAGQKIYFSDNGWTGSGLRGVTATDSDGNEGVSLLTITADIPAGRVIKTNTTGSDFAWTTSGTIPNSNPGSTGTFTNHALGTGGEQIVAFEGPDNHPAGSPSSFLYLLDNTGGFEPATSSSTGDVPAGLTSGTTAVSLPTTRTSGTYGLDLAVPAVAALQASGGTKAEWLAIIANNSNWGTSQPTANLQVVPEPGTAAMSALTLLALVSRRRRAGR